ncbi:hypothetical protein, conserved [Eimeria brunetti]|uniref:Transmembrane protein n=1 Tax=Eimeria brunetti TaxID=51314 RepID=U6LM88_9EIME|nr:hypothetical protein, conserved [Eimeria brunetti]
MGTRFQPPVTTDHHHAAAQLGLRRDLGNNPYSSSFDEETDEEIFDRPLSPYDAFAGDPPLQLRPALVEAGPRVYASPLGGSSSSRSNFNGVSPSPPLYAITREASHLTNANSNNKLPEIQTRGRGEGKGDDDDPIKSCLEEIQHHDEGGMLGCSSQQREETQDPTSPSFVAVDVMGEKKLRQGEQLPPTASAEKAQLDYSGGGNKQKWSKAYNENPSDAAQIAEEAFSKVKFWREVFSGLTGMHGVYVLANFAFDNPAGGICSLFCFLCSAFAQVDRRAPSYFLTALLSFCFGIVVAVSLGTPVRGFEAFSTNPLLRRICITQACLLLLATPVAVLVALRIIELHSFLREPGVLIPLDCTEETTETEQKDAQDDASVKSEQHADNDQPFHREATACVSQEEIANQGRRPSFEGN